MKKNIKKIINLFFSYKWSKKVVAKGKNIQFYRTTRISFSEGATPQNIIINENSRIHGELHVCNEGKIIMGKHTKIGPNSSIKSLNCVRVGDYTAIAQGVTVCDNNNHPVNPIDRRIMRKTKEGSYERSWIHSDSRPIIIGENVWIGENVRINKGVHIGDNAILAANSVVTKDVPANAIAAGNPARVVKTGIDQTTQSIFSR